MQQVKEPMDLHNNLRALRIFTELRSADSFTCEDVSLCRSGYSSGVTECCLFTSDDLWLTYSILSV